MWFDFSEPVDGFNIPSLSTVGGRLTDLSGGAGLSASGRYFTATFIADVGIDLVGSITVSGTYLDLVGNQGSEATISFPINTIPQHLNFGDAPTAAQSVRRIIRLHWRKAALVIRSVDYSWLRRLMDRRTVRRPRMPVAVRAMTVCSF